VKRGARFRSAPPRARWRGRGARGGSCESGRQRQEELPAGQVAVTSEDWGIGREGNSSPALFRELARLEGATERPSSRRGTVVYSPGEASESVFLLKSGKVKLVHVGPGAKRLIAHLVGPGEIFGEAALIGESHRGHSAEVLESASLWVIPRRALLEWLRSHPEAWRALAAVLAQRLRGLQWAVERLLFWEVEQRVVRLLMALAEQFGEASPDGIELNIELSQKELAHLIGSTRETTSSALNHLRRQGLIQIRRRRLCIRSLADLARVAPPALPPKRPPKREKAAGAVAVRSAAAPTQ